MWVLAMVLSVLIGVTLGLLGGGGSILTTPILIYALGVEPKPAIATSLIIVGVTSLAAVVQHARAGNVVWKTGAVFGAAGMVGAYGGGYIADWFSETTLLVLFGMMMLATAGAMLRGRKEPVATGGEHPLWKVVIEGTVVGVVTGLVGAGGGFLVVPALALMGGLPMPKAVGTSLLVIAMKSFAGYLGHATHVEVDLGLAGAMSAAAVGGSFLGSALVHKVPPELLRKGFAIFVLVMAVFVLYQQT